jgi:hypothetical protein
MAYFPTENPNLGKFWRVLHVGIFYGRWVYFTDICNILRPFGICILPLFAIFFPSFGMFYEERSGNPGASPRARLESGNSCSSASRGFEPLGLKLCSASFAPAQLCPDDGRHSGPWLPDLPGKTSQNFGKIYQMTTELTKWP